MANGYSPGLTVSTRALIRRIRRLPLKGEVLVGVGDLVDFDTPVARALLPGLLQSIKAANILGIAVEELEGALCIKIADPIIRNQLIAKTDSFFGFFKSECRSPVDGVVETISHASGSVGVRRPPNPIVLEAYISGKVSEVLPEEGVVVEAEAAFIQGIFGVGGERSGRLKVLVQNPWEILQAASIDDECRGCILVGGAQVTAAALHKAADVGATGVVCGGVADGVLTEFIGFNIGVAITGDENIPLTLVVSEGFGAIPMAQRTFDLLISLEGKAASINGATQIRAGVIRPEIIVPLSPQSTVKPLDAMAAPSVGSAVRIVREPYFGELATIYKLPSQPTTVGSGAVVRVLEAVLKSGEHVVVPRANVEVINAV